ncbi:MAG: glycosyltransferase [Myxococcales bacterium]|nr:glycosyltransferase [Myxococcales bacterium]
MKALYVTWDGPDQPYLESLFFPLFEAAGRAGVSVHVAQFSWGEARVFEEREAVAARHGITYEYHRVPRRPLQLATAAAIAAGALHVAKAVRARSVEVVVPRSHIPAAMVLAATPLLPPVAIAWDSDGLVPDERADFGSWRRDGVNYRLFRAVERAMLRRAEATLTRTRAAAALFRERVPSLDASKLHVVPNGKDVDQFSPGASADRSTVRRALGLTPEQLIVVYAGSIGPQYHPQAMAEVFRQVQARVPNAHFLVLTGAADAVRGALREAGVDRGFTIRRVPPGDVPGLLAAADVGLAFREPALSMRGVCPIKVAEYLLCGVPVVANTGVGDLDAQLSADVAHLCPDFNAASLRAAADFVVDSARARRDELRSACRAAGVREYSLVRSVDGYVSALTGAVDRARQRPRSDS